MVGKHSQSEHERHRYQDQPTQCERWLLPPERQEAKHSNREQWNPNRNIPKHEARVRYETPQIRSYQRWGGKRCQLRCQRQIQRDVWSTEDHTPCCNLGTCTERSEGMPPSSRDHDGDESQSDQQDVQKRKLMASSHKAHREARNYLVASSSGSQRRQTLREEPGREHHSQNLRVPAPSD